jgi:hypothetical protein
VVSSVPWKFVGTCYRPLVRLSVIIFLLKLAEYLFYNWSLALTIFKRSTCNLTVKDTWVQKGSLYKINLIARVCSASSHDVSTGCQRSGRTTHSAYQCMQYIISSSHCALT